MNRADLFWDKYWARYLFLPTVPDHVLELIAMWVPGHALRFFFFFLRWPKYPPPPNLPTFRLCNTIQLYILVVAQFFFKEDSIEIQRSCRAKEHRRIDKDSKDHRMPFYHGLLEKLNKVHDKRKRKYKE